MTVSRFDAVIDAIDNLIDDEVDAAPVRFTPNGLSDREIEDFITATLARGEDGMGAATSVAAPVIPHPPVRPAPRRSGRRSARRTAPVEPRPNRYAAVCRACGESVPAGEGLLTRERGKWVVQHAAMCPVTDTIPAPTPRRTPTRRAAAVVDSNDDDFEPEPDSDCYVVTVEVEVVKDGVRTAREAALLALREVFSGEVIVTVTDPKARTHEVNVTV